MLIFIIVKLIWEPHMKALYKRQVVWVVLLLLLLYLPRILDIIQMLW